MFLSLDGTFWIQLINFAIFFAILKVVFLRPVGEALEQRRAYIESVQSDYERYVQEAKFLQAQADAQRTQARREAGELFVNAREESGKQAMGITADHAGKASALVQQAHATIAGELKAAHERKHALAQTLAQTLLQRAIGALR